MKRFLVGLVGALLVLLSLTGALATGWVLSVFGTDGRYDMPVAEVDVPSAALYVNLFDVRPESFVPKGLLDTYLEGSSPDGKELFLGVGEQEVVQDFLLGVPYEAASELADGTFVTRPVPGLMLPAPKPTSVDFWDASAVGLQPRLLWTGQTGQGVLVVMNADGTAGVTATLTATLESPRLLPATAVLAVVSLISAAVGILLLVKAFRSDRGDARG